MAAGADALFLGLDSSTQGLKATVIDDTFNVVASAAVNYQKDLPHYGTTNGVHVRTSDPAPDRPDPGTPGTAAGRTRVTQPTIMSGWWDSKKSTVSAFPRPSVQYVEALDMLLQRLASNGCPIDRVQAVSGSGQQHGSVYWRTGARSLLSELRPKLPLKEQLAGAFRVSDSPIWMDSSTRAQCADLEARVGGAARLAAITGSRAYERFTGNQIAKIAAEDPKAYAETERISLISSMMCSVLRGDYAPIDFADGSGMNLLDIHTKTWSDEVLRARTEAPGLAAKLGAPAPSHVCVGDVSPYFVHTHSFRADCKVIAWSGDNPCSVAGLGLRTPGDIAVSLGTSDTLFGITSDPKPGLDGHIFVNPVDPESYMAMLCYKNGSLTRERVRDAAAGGNWDAFNAALIESAPGNDGLLGYYFDLPEITPTVLKPGIRRFLAHRSGVVERVSAFPSPAHDVRAVVEGQFLSMRVHGEAIGITHPTRLIATGGASANAAITQVLADVFGAPVFVAAQSDSASLGAAYRAAHGWLNHTSPSFVTFDRFLRTGVHGGIAGGGDGPIKLRLIASPRADAHRIYSAMLEAYKVAEKEVLAE